MNNQANMFRTAICGMMLNVLFVFLIKFSQEY